MPAKGSSNSGPLPSRTLVAVQPFILRKKLPHVHTPAVAAVAEKEGALVLVSFVAEEGEPALVLVLPYCTLHPARWVRVCVHTCVFASMHVQRALPDLKEVTGKGNRTLVLARNMHSALTR